MTRQRVLIRDFIPGEEAELRRVFASSVHTLARDFYTRAQLDAWAPAAYDGERGTVVVMGLAMANSRMYKAMAA